MGLKGLNLTDRMLFWELKRTWDVIRIASLDKKISHPLTIEVDKIALNRQKDAILNNVQKCE